MYAVIESGGKQYRVELGNEIEVARMGGEPGDTVEIDRVLLVADGDDAAIGTPIVEGARVSARVLRQGRGEKIVVFKYRPKARTRVKQGHRQDHTVLRIDDIVLGDKSAARQAEAARTERQRLEAAAAEEAARKAAEDKALADRLRADAPATGEEAAQPARTGRTRAAAGKPAESAESKPRRAPTARTQAPEPESKPRRAPGTRKDE
jgi:large subunit ribosomal protein L21